MKVVHQGETYELPYHTEEELKQEQEIDPEAYILAARYPITFIHVWKKFKVKDLQPVL